MNTYFDTGDPESRHWLWAHWSRKKADCFGADADNESAVDCFDVEAEVADTESESGNTHYLASTRDLNRDNWNYPSKAYRTDTSLDIPGYFAAQSRPQCHRFEYQLWLQDYSGFLSMQSSYHLEW